MHTFVRGDVLFREGHEPDKLYLVESGDFKLLKKVEMPSLPVKHIEVSICSRGTLLGESGLVESEHHH